MPKNKPTFLSQLPGNIFSGFVVSLIALPLGLGLALASEAPPISGIISAIVGGIVVTLFGGSHVTITGPGYGLVVVLLSSITSLGNGDLQLGFHMTLGAIALSGIIMIVMGFLRLGSLSDFFPSSTIQGMLAAIGIGIIAKQFHVMLGITNAKGNTFELLLKFPSTLAQVFDKDYPHLFAAVLGVLCLAIMFLYRNIRNKFLNLIPAPMWIVVLSVGMSYYYKYFSASPFPIENQLMIQIPDNVLTKFAFPNFSRIFDFEFIGFTLAITLFSSIESLLSIKAVDQLDPLKRRSNVNKDLKALGLASTLSAFVGGLNVVAVIARSSVNVNNGATQRVANLFHALFLLLFFILFGVQIKMIPLPALAAILVFTGYKLAAPYQLVKTLKIGNEQMIIFLSTLIVTVISDLITGILFGILTTFIIHVWINKSLGLFIRNLLKPNVLMYQEADNSTENADKFYVSITNFCSFLNFSNLKNKLDQIPENKDVIVDFSRCSFVDHTVMENLNNYIDTFESKNGNFEVIGLDLHSSNSEHPFALRRKIESPEYNPKNLTKRQKLLMQTAEKINWDYHPVLNNDLGLTNKVGYFKTRIIKQIKNILQKDKMVLFDVIFTEGEFIAKQLIRTTMLHLRFEKPIPSFTLDREGLFEYIYQFAGFNDIDIPKHPDFSKRFYLYGKDEKGITKFFTDELILFFESNAYYHVESTENGLLIMHKERLASVKEVKAMIDFGSRLHDLIVQQTKE